MEKTNADIVAAIIIGSILFIILAVVILLFFLFFIKKKRVMEREKELMATKFHQALLSSQLEIQEATFNVISQEIHDHVGQSLSLAKVQVNLLEQGVDEPVILQELKQNLSIAMQDLRDIAKSLSGERLTDIGLEEAIRWEAERVKKGSRITTVIRKTGDKKEIEGEREVILFRMVQEGLQNCIKHSEARLIEIMIHYEDAVLGIEIKDDGKGFERDKKIKSGGLGLLNMHKRVKLLGGEMVVDSEEGKGTKIKIEVPYG